MTDIETPWPERLTAMVAPQVKRYRLEQGLRGEDLAQRCTQLGYKLDKYAISKLEAGVRKSLSLAELLVLAAALRVPPLALLVPVQTAESAELLAREDLPLDVAVEWLDGSQAVAEVPGATGDSFALAGRRLRMLRNHGRERRGVLAARAAMRDVQMEQQLRPDSHFAEDAQVQEWEVRRAELRLARIRAFMREAGWSVLPHLGEDLEHVDRIELPQPEEADVDA